MTIWYASFHWTFITLHSVMHLICFCDLPKVVECRSGNKQLVQIIQTIFLSIFALISLASVRNASSTFTLAFALVSMNFIPCSIANCSPRSLDTWRLSVISHLLPRIIFSTSREACWKKMVTINDLHIPWSMLANLQQQLMTDTLSLCMTDCLTDWGLTSQSTALTHISLASHFRWSY